MGSAIIPKNKDQGLIREARGEKCQTTFERDIKSPSAIAQVCKVTCSISLRELKWLLVAQFLETSEVRVFPLIYWRSSIARAETHTTHTSLYSLLLAFTLSHTSSVALLEVNFLLKKHLTNNLWKN